MGRVALQGGSPKMTVQLSPLGARGERKVRLQSRRGNAWQTITEAAMAPAARTATFRVGRWNDHVDTRYRVACLQRTI